MSQDCDLAHELREFRREIQFYMSTVLPGLGALQALATSLPAAIQQLTTAINTAITQLQSSAASEDAAVQAAVTTLQGAATQVSTDLANLTAAETPAQPAPAAGS